MSSSASSSSQQISLTKETVMRLVKDVKEIIKSPLTSHGIYYHHDDTDMLKGKALIIGPKGTPYEYGYYLFKFSFPTNYPHAPPVVTFYTCDSVTRFNPNLYINGKVCLSILNTWNGDQWTGCQTISSVLLALCTVLNDKPLLNEPGVTIKHKDYKKYNKIIEYSNISVAIYDILVKKNGIAENFSEFIDIMKKNFIDNYDAILEKINKNITLMKEDTEVVQTELYNMKFYINYKNIKTKIMEFKDTISSE